MGTRKRAAGLGNEAIAAATPGEAVEIAPTPDPPDAGSVAVGLGIVANPAIVIEMDPAMSGGNVRGRFDVMIRGRVVSSAPIAEIRLQVDDWVTSIASFGQPERAAVMPAHQRGFQFNLPRPGDGRAERCVFRIIARTEDGFELTENFEIDLDPTAGNPVSVIAGPTRAMAGAAYPYAVMYIERGTIDGDGTLAVSGWVVSQGPTLAVQVYADEERISNARIGVERQDVAAVFPAYPNARLSGFSLTLQLDDVRRNAGRIRAQVVCPNGFGHAESIPVERLREQSAARQQHATGPATAAVPQAADGPKLDSEDAKEFRFEMDSPTVSNGAAVALVTGRLTIDGWLLTRSGIASFEIFLDGQRLGDAHYGLARQDVGAAFPEWPNALRSGFAFHCPPRSLRDGEHTVEIRIRANCGVELHRAFSFTVQKAEDQQDSIGIRRRVPRVEADMMTAFLADMDYRPSFQFILRQDRRVEIDRLRGTFDALRLQAYADWTVLILAEDDHAAAATKAVIDDALPNLADRFTVVIASDASKWSAPLVSAPLTAAGADAGRPVLHLLLLPGDEPGADALLELAVASGRHPDRDLLYGDEVRLSPVSKDQEPFFKPDFSPDLLLSTNYIGRPWVATSALLAKTGATPASLIADGEYDLLLRCSELAAGVHHIPKLLCQRSAMALDDAGLEEAALERALDRRGIAGEVLSTAIQGTWRVRRTVPLTGKVSIIIPTCASQGYIETCISTLRAQTTYHDYEIVCIDNIPQSGVAWKVWLQQHADKVIEIPDAFNWSVFNNRAAEIADGEFLLFLNDDIEIIQDGWLDSMLEHARRPEVGVTGPQLLYGDGKVQHAGMFLANNGIGRHAFRFAASDDPCYFGLALTQRNVIAVTGACMLVRRETFERLGRFDEAHEIVNNDLDFCLRVHRAGLLTVFTPYATLTHHELASRANLKDVFDLTHFNAAWKTTFAAGDPYFNPRLSRHADDYRPDDEPVQWVVSGTPLFLPAEIRRILVIKLDHIGDFVTALPPIRRLKKLFPHARITVLAGPASRAFVSLEPCIDEFIPFAFFHARSQLGERDLTPEDYAELAEQLRPYRFDLAVDLRKHLSTRDVLKYTGASFLAGFDYLGQFPYLDIALDWDGDRTLQRKRSHIVDDLMALVNAIGHASETDRLIIQPSPETMPLTELPEGVRRLFAKPVVAIHPGAGNVTKQWPEEHFSALIDLLVEKNDVNILLVGGADEIEVASALQGTLQRPDAVASMVGRTSLADLPRLLRNCVLYIGNDSGPKHIAAAVGIPTVGIHSGVVDPVEWGPMGPNAVALRRNMTCSPCYLAKAEDCPRALACLRFFEPNLVYETADMFLKRPGDMTVAPRTIVEVVALEVVRWADASVVNERKTIRRSKAKRPHHATEPA
jgi:ADP-heptose:LPS heptosyltransferase/GT2 family glycosyltransferase